MKCLKEFIKEQEQKPLIRYIKPEIFDKLEQYLKRKNAVIMPGYESLIKPDGVKPLYLGRGIGNANVNAKETVQNGINFFG